MLKKCKPYLSNTYSISQNTSIQLCVGHPHNTKEIIRDNIQKKEIGIYARKTQSKSENVDKK